MDVISRTITAMDCMEVSEFRNVVFILYNHKFLKKLFPMVDQKKRFFFFFWKMFISCVKPTGRSERFLLNIFNYSNFAIS